ncbi:MAG: phosphoribosylamine--glycine ligase [Planctomycetota bacterium]|jgi:phosphoribosylamine--glycine ligase
MKVLVVGSGGREHALAWKIKQSPLVRQVFCASGNGGIQGIADCVDISSSNIPGLIEFARRERVDFTIVGPEQPLADGIVDEFEQKDLPIFGPSRAAAQLEASKGFAKQFMKRHGIPTAQFEIFDNYEAARTYLESLDPPVVVKADGLAAGKGALVCRNIKDAITALDDMILKDMFGEAGKKVVIEEFLEGQELSVLAISDGQTAMPLVPAQDHKPIFDGDKGPNTGGMGAFAPVGFADQHFMARVQSEILDPVIRGFAGEGIQYKGVLYAGLMVTTAGPKVIEFNVRFGDPETQAILPLLDFDLVELLMEASAGKLPEALKFKAGNCTCVVLASEGYPGRYEKGKEIFGLMSADLGDEVSIFHAGTRLDDGKFFTSGGRVLGVTAYGDTLQQSIDKAYEAVGKIHFDGAYYRSDIGQKGLRYRV